MGNRTVSNRVDDLSYVLCKLIDLFRGYTEARGELPPEIAEEFKVLTEQAMYALSEEMRQTVLAASQSEGEGN